MKKLKTINSFFNKKSSTEVDTPSSSEAVKVDSTLVNVDSSIVENRPLIFERDPGLRPQIWEYPVNQQDEMRQAYVKAGPYQHKLLEYPSSGEHNRRFQYSWFEKFPWLEYSPTKDAAYCSACYIFNKQLSVRFGTSAFTIEGFRNWKKVNGKDCAFLSHVGKDHCSPHNIAVKSCVDLMVQSQHIDKVMDKQNSQQISMNRLRVGTSIDALRYCAFQGIAFRGYDETPESINRGNFIQVIKLLRNYNKEVNEVVLENAPGNAMYISSNIQKDLLSIMTRMVQDTIRKEIGDSKYCIIVNESRDESKREQMAIVIRFVDVRGYVQERFLDLVHVKDTSALTLKNEISTVLSYHNLSIQDIRGQGYDGASNMRGEWKGLKTLFINECSQAYYVHCFAHKLQLVLVATSKEVKAVHNFFNELIYIINTVGVSSKRNNQMRAAQKEYFDHMIALSEIVTGTGANQIGSLQRHGDTRWSSHLNSVCSVINMYTSTCSVLLDISDNGGTSAQRGDAEAAFKKMIVFEFVFILHLMKEVLGISDILCKALQHHAQDILNAISLVSTTKTLIQKLRATGWEKFLHDVKLFCEKNEVEVPEMSARYSDRRFRSPRDIITVEHHFRVGIFNATIDCVLQELNSRFSENSMELLRLSMALDPSDGFKSFNIDDICALAKKFYHQDFSEHEIYVLNTQLQHYELDVPSHEDLKDLPTISKLCEKLVETKKSKTYYLIDKLIRLILTLPVSKATTERSFSAMKLVKTRLRNKMEDEFLANCMTLYIEREIAEKIDKDLIIDEFYEVKNRRAQLK